MQLSAHFSLAEFCASSTAASLGIDNSPTSQHLENLKRTAEGMEKVRALLGNQPIKITSAYRNPQLNAAVKGTPTSAHPLGFAADFRHSVLSPLACARKIRDSDLMFDQCLLETGRGVVHISFDPRTGAGGPRRKVGEQAGGPGTKIVWKLPA
jgi:zinc D-Ala-D-Ala carboxypeptidase